jgi:redox-sensitive bicupin YhaK (pirin superfamily)
MKTVFHPADSRGSADHGWLKAKHSFSFASFHDPEKVHFGALRVLNDDQVAKGMGFSTHPHDNMEIITIPLSGTVRHKDSMGNEGNIHAGEIQVMSAGTGVLHSEFNPSHTEDLKLFQIWIIPNKRNVEPRYDQFQIDTSKMANHFLQLVSPDKEGEGTWINQDAWIKMAEIEGGNDLTYNVQNQDNGVYFMLVEGKAEIAGESLGNRDAIGVYETDEIVIKASEKSKILAIEVPMNI